jgi:hypothetical protein
MKFTPSYSIGFVKRVLLVLAVSANAEPVVC